MKFMGSWEAEFERSLDAGVLDAALGRWSAGEARLARFPDVAALVGFFRDLDQALRPAKEQALRALASLARQGQPDAATILIGLFLPLFRKVRREISTCPVAEAELEAEMLAALWEAVSTDCSSETSLSSRICYAVKKRSWQAVRVESSALNRFVAMSVVEDTQSAEFDLDPAEAVEMAFRDGALSARQSQLIRFLLIDGEASAVVARRMGISGTALKSRLWRAERKFLAWVRAEVGRELPA